MKNKIREVANRYGYIVLVNILEKYAIMEDFEKCTLIEQELARIENLLCIQIERTADIEDYRQGFWKLGLSGKTAVSNLPSYILEAFVLLESEN